VADLLPLLPYNSGLMRSLAGDLRNQARTLGTLGSDIASASSSMTFDGPAGDRIRSELGERSGEASRASDALGAAAGKLETAADDVDRQNAQIEAHNRKVLDDMPAIERKLILENT
jgi:uncharacterized protein YukE